MTKKLRSSIYGLHALAVGISLLPASIIAGFLWDIFGSPAPFWFGGAMGLFAAAALWVGLVRTAGLAGGLSHPYKGLLPAALASALNG